MSDEQSVRDEIESRIRKAISYGQGIERNRDLSSQQQADWIQEQVTLAVASPAIRRIQAEALREAADDWHEKHAGTRPAPYLFMVDRADAIERGETA